MCKCGHNVWMHIKCPSLECDECECDAWAEIVDCDCSSKTLFTRGCICGAFYHEKDADTLDFIINEEGVIIPLK